MSDKNRFFAQFNSAGSSGGGGSANTIYNANDTIGSGRVATISDTPTFQGDQATPIGLKIENQASGSNHTDCGVHLQLTSNADTGFISQYDSTSGGSNAPTMWIESPTGINYKANAVYRFGYHNFQTDNNVMFGIDRDGNSAILRSNLAGGGGNYTELQLAYTGGDYNFIKTHATTGGKFIFGRENGGSFEYMRIAEDGEVGINQSVPTAQLNVKGSGSTNATSSFLVENSSANQILNIYDDGSFEFGIGASINNDTCIAIGNNAKATAISSVSIGKNAGNGTTGQYSVAIGTDSDTGLYGTAIGQGSTGNTESVAIGSGATNTSTYSVSIGRSSNSGLRSVAIGNSTSVSAQNSVGIGYDADCTTNGVTIGGGIKNTGAYSIVLGSVAYAQTRTNANTHSFSVFTEDATPLIQIHRDNDSWIDSTGSLGINTMTPDSSSLLDLSSTTKGFLPPRMTTTEMNAISSVATGLMVYDTTTNQWMGYNGTSWVILG